MKSALFVDFDNIYSGLRRLDPATADRFAKSPMDWVSWMVNSMALPTRYRHQQAPYPGAPVLFESADVPALPAFLQHGRL